VVRAREEILRAAGTRVTCVVCGLTKAPTGRSVSPAMAGSFCDRACPGWECRPLPGSLWPGETREEFGFACSTAEELAGKGPVYRG